MVLASQSPDFSLIRGVLYFRNRLCVPWNEEPKRRLLHDLHHSKFSIHSGVNKMYRDIHRNFWWKGMKRDVARYISRCLICQQVKAENVCPVGLLQPLPVPLWKWENITMDFLVGLPKTASGHDVIWVIVDRLTKSAHFIPIRMAYGLR